MKLIDPAIGLKLVILGGWLLAVIGLLKVVLYLVGEFFPGAYSRIRSEALRRFLTGKGNRFIFGLGGILTALLGFFFVIVAYFILWLFPTV